jgi:glycosyltransferase involved in cell wall biosynthesis
MSNGGFLMQASVCIITTVHPPFDTRIFHKQAKTLVQAGYNVTLIAQHDGDEEVEGVRIKGLPKPRNRFTRIFGLTWRAFHLALKQKADIYHFHDPELLAIALFLKAFTKGRIIYDVHEDYSKKILAKKWLKGKKLVAGVYRLVEKQVPAFLDAVIAATDGIAKGFPISKVHTVRNYPLGRLVKKQKLKTDRLENAFRIIYTGGVTRNRGLLQIVQSLEYIDDARLRLVLLGRADDNELLKEVRALPGFSKVDYHGLVPFEEVYRYMGMADVGMLCNQPVHSYDTSLPNKLFEYMSAGLPVIASDFPGWKEIVERLDCGITVNSQEPREIAEGIRYFMQHPDLRVRMGHNARMAVLEKYNWEKESEELLSLYEKVTR